MSFHHDLTRQRRRDRRVQTRGQQRHREKCRGEADAEGRGQQRMGGSILAQTQNQFGGAVPDLDDAQLLKSLVAAINELRAANKLLAYHDRGDGGLWATACEMAFAGHLGVSLNVDMLVTASGYSAQTHELGGKAVEGLYGVSVLPHPYEEGANRQLVDWIERYRKRFGAAPNVWSVMGYGVADLFVRAAQQAGPELSNASFIAAMETLHTSRDFFGSPEYRFSREDHLGNRHGRLARIQDGRWVIQTDYLK